jgi:hypothetical protein
MLLRSQRFAGACRLCDFNQQEITQAAALKPLPLSSRLCKCLFSLRIAFSPSIVTPLTSKHTLAVSPFSNTWCLYIKGEGIYRLIYKSLRKFRTRLPTTKINTAERSVSIGRESVQVCLGNGRLGVLAGFTDRGQSWRNMAWTGDKKAFCVLEFDKTELIVTIKMWFRTMYHTEPPTDKTIREWYMKFQQSGCLCAAKRTGHRPWLSSVCEKLLSGLTKGGHIEHL